MRGANDFRSASCPRPAPPFRRMEERVPRVGDDGRDSEIILGALRELIVRGPPAAANPDAFIGFH